MSPFSQLPLKLTLLFLFTILTFTTLFAETKKGTTLGKSQAAASPSVHFFTFGDWGAGNESQKAVAEQTQRVCQKFRCDFGLTLGDNFYPNGVASVDDPYWQGRYRDLYHPLKVPFFASLGNHDYKGNAQAQIDFSKKDPYWKMPGPFYSLRYPEKGDPLLEIFVLDSHRFDEANLNWLTKALGASTAKWKMLAFHHPILNNGTRHPSDQKGLWPRLKPIACGKIDLILSGHEHIFSHLQEKENLCRYDQVIAGTGGKEVYGVKAVPPPELKVFFSEASFGLAFFEVSAHELRLQYYRANGERPYQYTWNKP